MIKRVVGDIRPLHGTDTADSIHSTVMSAMTVMATETMQ
jgi:hypothetical protein